MTPLTVFFSLLAHNEFEKHFRSWTQSIISQYDFEFVSIDGKTIRQASKMLDSTYLIVAYMKHSLKSKLSIYEIMQILSISIFDKTPVKELLTESQFNQNVKEQINLLN
jgi:hypothetical protein